MHLATVSAGRSYWTREISRFRCWWVSDSPGSRAIAKSIARILIRATLRLISVWSLTKLSRLRKKRGNTIMRERERRRDGGGGKGGEQTQEREKQKRRFPSSVWMQSISRNAILRPECRETCIHIMLLRVHFQVYRVCVCLCLRRHKYACMRTHK